MKKFAFSFLIFASATLNAQNVQQDSISEADKAMLEIKMDSAMVLPESMEPVTDTLFQYNWSERFFIHYDSTCVSDSDVPPVPDSVYIARLRALPTKIAMPFNQPVRQCLDMYVHKRRDLVERMVGSMNTFCPDVGSTPMVLR